MGEERVRQVHTQTDKQRKILSLVYLEVSYVLIGHTSIITATLYSLPYLTTFENDRPEKKQFERKAL